MTASQFMNKWMRVELKEHSASQQHFLDLCELFDHPKPAEADPTGESFTFEKGAGKLDGGDGWADVWKKHFFAWEYKGKHINLEPLTGSFSSIATRLRTLRCLWPAIWTGL